MDESPSELIAEWLGLEKEYARLGDQARQIMDASGIKDQEEEFRMLSAGYLENGIWRPYSENPSHQLFAIHETWKIRAKQHEIEQEMKKMETRAITQGIALPELTLIEFPRPAEEDDEDPFDGLIGPPPKDLKPAAPPIGSPVPDVPPAAEIPASAGRSAAQRKARQRIKKATDDEKVIIDAIKAGLRGPKFCKYLDGMGVAPRASWLDESRTLYPWPGKYLKAYLDDDDDRAAFWQRRIQDYKNKIKKKFGL